MYHFLLLLSTPHLSLNQNLTLNYADSSLPSSTTFNEFAQMVLERLYPNEIDLNAMEYDHWTTIWGAFTYNPIVGKLGYYYNNTYNCKTRTVTTIDTDLTKLRIRGKFPVSACAYYLTLRDATMTTAIKNFYYSGSEGVDFDKTYDISDVNEPFIVEFLCYGSANNQNVTLSMLKLTN